MTFDRERHRRRSLRLRGYDYGQPGLYFVSVCTWGREPTLGEVADGEACPNGVGTFVWRVWEGLPERFPGVEVDAFVVMPNHVHGIVFLGADPEADRRGLGEGRARPAPTSVAGALGDDGKATPVVGAGLALPSSATWCRHRRVQVGVGDRWQPPAWSGGTTVLATQLPRAHHP